jgi:hypothetical protein
MAFAGFTDDELGDIAVAMDSAAGECEFDRQGATTASSRRSLNAMGRTNEVSVVGVSRNTPTSQGEEEA